MPTDSFKSSALAEFSPAKPREDSHQRSTCEKRTLSSEQLIGGRNRIGNCTHTHVIVHRAWNALIGQRGEMITCARFGDRWVTICSICVSLYNSAFISSILFRIVLVFNIRDIKKLSCTRVYVTSDPAS